MNLIMYYVNFLIPFSTKLDINMLKYIRSNSLKDINIILKGQNDFNLYFNNLVYIYNFFNDDINLNYKNVNIFNYYNINFNKLEKYYLKNEIINFTDLKMNNLKNIKLDEKEFVEIKDINLLYKDNFSFNEFEKINLGGTFNFLHTGHKLLLTAGMELTNNFEIFITSQKMLEKKLNKHFIENFEYRKKNIENFMEIYKKNLNYKINLLEDPIGPLKDDNSSLIVSEESLKGGLYVNNIRKEKGLKEMKLIIINNWDNKNIDTNDKISSSYFRNSININEEEFIYLKNEFYNSIKILNEKILNESENNFLIENWFNFIWLKYSEKQRFYHNINHILDCLKKIKLFNVNEKEKSIITIILFFHDIIYDPKKSNNEELSAELFKNFNKNIDLFNEKELMYYYCIIINTKNHLKRVNNELINNIVLDIDFSIFCCSSENYIKYVNKIKEEFSFVPIEIFKEKRKSFLEEILKADSIFYNNNIFSEKEAKLNIKNELINY